MDPSYEDKRIGNVKELKVYQMAFESAMFIFNLTKKFPIEERYGLIDQMRRSSRSVCSNLAEAWHKRCYKAVFKNKLSDCSQEAAETQTWLQFSLHCEYISPAIYNDLENKYSQIFAMLHSMEKKADKFCVN